MKKNVVPIEDLLKKSWPILRRPPIKNFDAALKAYYCSDGYIGSHTIAEIFGYKTLTAANVLKRAVRNVEIDNDIPMVVPKHVNVRVAFALWNIDPEELARKKERMVKLGLK